MQIFYILAPTSNTYNSCFNFGATKNLDESRINSYSTALGIFDKYLTHFEDAFLVERAVKNYLKDNGAIVFLSSGRAAEIGIMGKDNVHFLNCLRIVRQLKDNIEMTPRTLSQASASEAEASEEEASEEEASEEEASEEEVLEEEVSEEEVSDVEAIVKTGSDLELAKLVLKNFPKLDYLGSKYGWFFNNTFWLEGDRKIVKYIATDLVEMLEQNMLEVVNASQIKTLEGAIRKVSCWSGQNSVLMQMRNLCTVDDTKAFLKEHSVRISRQVPMSGVLKAWLDENLIVT